MSGASRGPFQGRTTSVVAEAATSPAALAPGSTAPVRRRPAPRRYGLARAREQARAGRRRESPGRAWASSAAAPAAEAAATLVPVTEVNAGSPSAGRAGSEVAMPTPGRGELRREQRRRR